MEIALDVVNVTLCVEGVAVDTVDGPDVADVSVDNCRSVFEVTESGSEVIMGGVVVLPSVVGEIDVDTVWALTDIENEVEDVTNLWDVFIILGDTDDAILSVVNWDVGTVD